MKAASFWRSPKALKLFIMAAEDDSGCLNLIDPNDGEFSNSSGSFSGFSPLREEELQAAKKAKKGKQKAASKTSQKASKKVEK